MTEAKYRLTAVDAVQHNVERPRVTEAVREGQLVPFIMTKTNDDRTVNGRAIIGGDDPLIFHFTRIYQGPENGQWSR